MRGLERSIDEITAKDSRLSGQEVKRTIAWIVQWIQEHPWEFEENIFGKIQLLQADLDRQIMIAEAVDEAFQVSDQTPEAYTQILKTAALHLPDLIAQNGGIWEDQQMIDQEPLPDDWPWPDPSADFADREYPEENWYPDFWPDE